MDSCIPYSKNRGNKMRDFRFIIAGTIMIAGYISMAFAQITAIVSFVYHWVVKDWLFKVALWDSVTTWLWMMGIGMVLLIVGILVRPSDHNQWNL